MRALFLLVTLAGCAHAQHITTAYDHHLVRWCEARPIKVNTWGLDADEQAAVIEAAKLWTQAAVRSSDLDTTRRRVELIPADRFADISISRNGGDWGNTELAVNPTNGCLLHAHIEMGPSLDAQVLLRAIAHEMGHALGLADSYLPGDIMQAGMAIATAP
jgi:hypothetical protein